jgi:hypothetical protein
VIRYAGRTVPWRLVTVCCAIIMGLMTLVAIWPTIMWPLQGTAVGVVAGIVAWSMDERSAAVVDTTPRALWWRTTARAVVVPVVLLVWTGCLTVAGDRLPQHFRFFIAQAAVAAGAALAVTLAQRAGGNAEPGRRFAALVIPTAAALALARPLERWLPVFPIWPAEHWAASRALWSVLAVVFLLGPAALLLSQSRPARPALPGPSAPSRRQSA